MIRGAQESRFRFLSIGRIHLLRDVAEIQAGFAEISARVVFQISVHCQLPDRSTHRHQRLAAVVHQQILQ